MRIWEGIQHAIDSGFVPFVLSAGDRRSVKMNVSQIINALAIAAITAMATSFATVKVLEAELTNQRNMLMETRSDLRDLRNRVDSFHTRGVP